MYMHILAQRIELLINSMSANDRNICYLTNLQSPVFSTKLCNINIFLDGSFVHRLCENPILEYNKSFKLTDETMKTKTGFIEGVARIQATLFPELLDDYISEENPVRVIDVFVDNLDLSKLEFKTCPAKTGRPGYHPSSMLKLFIYGYLNRIQSSRRLERESGRNVELMWLLGRLSPDFKTIADFRKNNGKKNNYTPQKLKFHIERVEKHIDEYLKQIEAADSAKIKLLMTDPLKIKSLDSRKNFLS
jgi:transposase